MHKGRILLIDDEPKINLLLSKILQLEGYEVLQAYSAREARVLLAKASVPLILCDVKLPDANGLDLAAEFKAAHPLCEIILLTAYGTIADGVTAIKRGAFDYLTKGDDQAKVVPMVAAAMQKALSANNAAANMPDLTSVIGESAAIVRAKNLAKRVAVTDTTVLLTGETGTGKEVFAQAIHALSARAKQPFVAVNCSAFAKDLLESELFGYKAGAFTGANKDKKGLLEAAEGGTLFLDELGEMPPDVQAKLLRVLENGEYLRVGDTKKHQADVRIVAATHRNLAEEVQNGHFREDLFYRLSVFSIALPPLRERGNDILLLAHFFMQHLCKKLHIPAKTLGEAFGKRLLQHDWKGNIRELKNVMERALILADGDELTTDCLPLEWQTSLTQHAEVFALQDMEKQHIAKVLRHTGGNKTETAKLLNIGLTTLYRKIEEYGLK